MKTISLYFTAITILVMGLIATVSCAADDDYDHIKPSKEEAPATVALKVCVAKETADYFNVIGITKDKQGKTVVHDFSNSKTRAYEKMDDNDVFPTVVNMTQNTSIATISMKIVIVKKEGVKLPEDVKIACYGFKGGHLNNDDDAFSDKPDYHYSRTIKSDAVDNILKRLNDKLQDVNAKFPKK